jgi:capsular polysaccharide transport system permease protein
MSMIGGGASSSNNNYMVTDYLTSQQVVEELQRRVKLESLYSKPGIDWWARFNRTQPVERLVQYWKGMVTAQYDMITGIATAEVRAFSPQDALLVANTLVTLSEELVNQVANRSQQDAVRFAQQEVDKAQDRLKRFRAQLTAYRNKFGVIDPTTSVAASNSSLTQTQRANLAQLETQLATLISQRLAPNAPAVVGLKNQIKSTKEQLAKTEADVGQGLNGSALSTIVGDYEQLNLEVQFAQAMVTSTMQALDQARANAAAQHLYITPYVRPSLPESSTYPRRFLSIATVGALAFAFWLIGLMIVRSIRERFA